MTIPVNTEQHIYLDDFGYGKTVTDVIKLPGGEFHPNVCGWKTTSANRIVIHTRLRSGDDLIKLLTVTNAIRNFGIKDVSVFLPYIPGGRQDRIANQGEAFTLKVFADIINSQNYTRVFTIDPHSDVTTALINNCVVIPVAPIIKRFVNDYDVVIVPDAGASKKIYDYYLKGIDYQGKIVQCLKKRDTKTGKLSGFEIVNPDLINSSRCVILDDIGDGFGTHIGLAKEILCRNPCRLSVYVTHGIFSKGEDCVLDYFNEVITTNSFKPWSEYKSNDILCYYI